MKITGQLLKENRERRGVSISDVAIATKINVKTLQAMEEGDIDHLPPKTFLRGFVRAYAVFLEMNVDSVMSTFLEEMGSTKPKPNLIASDAPSEPSTSPQPKANPTDPDEAINPKTSLTARAITVAVIIVVVSLIVMVKNKMESYEQEMVVVPTALSDAPTAPLADPARPQDVAAMTTNPSPGPSAVASATASATPPATPSATPQPTPTATPQPSPSPTPSASPTPKATPTPQASPSATPKPSPSPSPKPSASPAATPAIATGNSQELLIEALGDVEATAQIDGEPAVKMSLKADQVQSLKGKRKIVLSLSNGGAVNLIVNGVERGVPGDLGKPIRVEFP